MKRTYSRNPPLAKRSRTASSPVPAADRTSSPPRPHPTAQAQPSLTPTSSLPPPPPTSSPRAAPPSSSPPALRPSVGLPSNPPARQRPVPMTTTPSSSAAVKGKARAALDPPRSKAPQVQGTLRGFLTSAPAPRRTASAPSAAGSSSRPSNISADPPSPTSSLSRAISTPTTISPSRTNAASGSSSLPALQQLLLAPLPSALQTCQSCHMTYATSSPADVRAHGTFHRTVERGVVWFRPGEVGERDGVDDVGGEVGWGAAGAKGGKGKGKGKGEGRFVRVRGVPAGKVGKKIKEIHALLDAHLSAPALPPSVLAQTQTFLLLSSSSPPPTSSSFILATATAATAAAKEYVIGACVVQRISSALRVLSPVEVRAARRGGNDAGVAGGSSVGGQRVVCVEPGDGPREGDEEAGDGGVFCDPTPISTLLGIHRIHVSTLFRRLSLAPALLTTVCEHAVYGVVVGPAEGQGGVAFSQPTRSGRRLMERWGMGEVRVFVEDEA